MSRKNSAFIYWTPRLLSILLILFLGLMSLDVISPELSLGQIIFGLFMHNIPAIILLIVLIISWKREIIGGIFFIIAGLLYIMFAVNSTSSWHMAFLWSIQISAPAFLIGILFMINWFNKDRQRL